MSADEQGAGKHTAPYSDENFPITWSVVDDGDDDISVCAFEGDPKNGIMADVICEVTSIRPEQDAKLIAAAPELLKELQHLVALLEPMERAGTLNVPGLATLNGARKAIALGDALIQQEEGE